MSSNEPLATPQYPSTPDPTPPTAPLTAPYPSSGYPAAPVPPTPSHYPGPPESDPVGSKDAGSDSDSTTQAVKDEAGKVADQAGASAQHVAGAAKEQVAQIADEAKTQVRDLWSQTRSELTEQAGAQQSKAAAGLKSLADQLRSMAETSEEPGVATDLAGQGADKVQGFADFLENRDPAGLLDEVRSFARQRPGAFLAIALGAGLLAGRLARGLAADPEEESARSTAQASRLDSENYVPPLTSGQSPSGYEYGAHATPALGAGIGSETFSGGGPIGGTGQAVSELDIPSSTEPAWNGRS